MIGGVLCGIEVTELVDQKSLQRSLKAKRAREAGQVPSTAAPEAYREWLRTQGEAYRDWTSDDLIAALRKRISAKDDPKKIKGGPYGRYLLVVVTDEFMLDRHTVEHLLAGASFPTTMIDEAYLGLSYHPSIEQGGGSCPVLRLSIVKGA